MRGPREPPRLQQHEFPISPERNARRCRFIHRCASGFETSREVGPAALARPPGSRQPPLSWSGAAPVAQWIEQRFPKPRALVRLRPGALLDRAPEVADLQEVLLSFILAVALPDDRA